MTATYLAVLKVLYDYESPQSEDEVAVKEDQLLFLLEKTDDDWWKVKIKSDSPDSESPSGLVPAAYVEEVSHKGVVKALYDYEANASGELSVKEDEVLYSYEADEGWMLVKSQDGGRVGYVPGSYVEEVDDSGHSQSPVSPASPSPPPVAQQPFVEPAVRAAAAADKSKADDIQTWSLSELDKKGKKKKGTLGVGNGAVFFASESDKTPVQKWPISVVDAVKTEKAKHVVIEIGGASPLVLRFHAGSKDNAEAIVKKVEKSIDLSASTSAQAPASPSLASSPVPRSQSPPAAPATTSAFRLPPIQTSMSEEPKKNGVHFATSPPSVIPRSDEGDEEEPPRGAVEGVALYDFAAGGDDELTVKEGEQLWILDRSSEDWWTCRNAEGLEGVVPGSYIELIAGHDSPHVLRAGSPIIHPDEGDEEDELQAARELEQQRETERVERERKEKQQNEQLEKERKRKEAERRERLVVEAERQKKQREHEAEESELKQDREEEEETTRKEAEAAAAAEVRRQQRRKEREAERAAGRLDKKSGEKPRGPLPKQARTWHDKTGQFKVDAEFLGLHNGKVRLHKMNGVVIEVPSAKMSPEDMDYIQRWMKKRAAAAAQAAAAANPSRSPDEDDVPLGTLSAGKRASSRPDSSGSPRPAPPKKGPAIDWFEFFLSAGCDIDECTRYAAAFERDKIDESLLPEIKDSTMRSLGLKEGDIIRVTKAIQKRTGTSPGPSGGDSRNHGTNDEEHAAQEDGSRGTPDLPPRQGTASPGAPNLFAGPGGILKNNTRRGRPQPSKSALPLNVDLDSISNASDTLSKRVASPGLLTPSSPSSLTAVVPPRRTTSVTSSGFDDNAWTNRPSSTKPSAIPAVAPPTVLATSPPLTPAPATLAPPITSAATAPSLPSPPRAVSTNPTANGNSDFELLAKISSMRPPSAPVAPLNTPSPMGGGTAISSPAGYQVGLGAGSSPLPIGQHLQNQQNGAYLSQNSGPRGPLAPVASNQPLLNPLIPTTTGFNSFIPTRPAANGIPPVPVLNQALSPPLQPSISPLISQPTGYFPQNLGGFGGLRPQPTGFATGPLGTQTSPSFFNNFTSPLQPNITGFVPSNTGFPSPSPPKSPPADNNSPANIFAQMKSGTFGRDDVPQPSDKYDALRPNFGPSLMPQQTGWGFQTGFPSQNGYSGFGH